MRKLCLFQILVVSLALSSRVAPGQSPSAPKPEPETGVVGVISAGPVQGGPSREGIPDSRPLANTEFRVVQENKTVASFQTDDQGRFKISLPPGHYTISRKDWNNSIGKYGPFEVEVAAGQMKRVHWDCDTGIR